MLAVLGSTGKNEDGDHISPNMYNNAYDILLDTMFEVNDFNLSSGGCAFADHLAIRAFNEGYAKSLTLFLPAEFSQNKYKQTKYGKVANHHHEHFSSICEIDSFSEISQAIENGAKVLSFKDFLDRNTNIIKSSDKMIAFSFSERTVVDDYFDDRNKANIGSFSTKDAWTKAKKYKFRRHVGYKGMRGFNE